MKTPPFLTMIQNIRSYVSRLFSKAATRSVAAVHADIKRLATESQTIARKSEEEAAAISRRITDLLGDQAVCKANANVARDTHAALNSLSN